MIQSNELRIGNIVEQGVVDSIGKTLIEVGGVIMMNTEVTSIPLTEEWLLRFGFKKEMYQQDEYGDYVEYHLEANDDVFMCYADDFSVGLYPEKKYMDNIQVVPNWTSANTVHGLQNLYFILTGKEIE